MAVLKGNKLVFFVVLEDFSIMQQNIHMQKMKLDPYFTPYAKINSNWVKPKCKNKQNYKTLQRKHGVNIHDLRVGIGSLDTTPTRAYVIEIFITIEGPMCSKMLGKTVMIFIAIWKRNRLPCEARRLFAFPIKN